MIRLIFLPALGAALVGCSPDKSAYELIRLQRGDLQLTVLPEVGGRLVYLGLEGHGNILKADSCL